MMNFWSWILAALLHWLQIIVFPLFGGAEGYHQAMGLASIIGSGAYAVLEVAMVALGQFNLLLPLTAMGISLLLFGIRIFVQIWLTVKSIVKIW